MEKRRQMFIQPFLPLEIARILLTKQLLLMSDQIEICYISFLYYGLLFDKEFYKKSELLQIEV